MNFVLYANDEIAKRLYNKGLLFKKRITFDVNEFNQDNIISIYKFKKEYLGEYIVIPSFISDDLQVDNIYDELLNLGFSHEKILFIPIEMVLGDEQVKFNKFYNYGEIVYLDYLEISINDGCNMNCKGCSHFANLAPKKNKDFSSFEADFRKLKTIFPHVFKIRIMGGEPFLNPEIDKYVKMIKEIYPYTYLRIVSNGILLNSMKKEVLELIKNNDVMIDISVYPLMQDKIDDIVERLKKYGVKLFLENITSFKPILLNKKTKYPFTRLNNCTCINLQDGKLAPCPLPFTIDYYNSMFETSMYSTKNSTINIYDENLSPFIIKKKLTQPFQLCDYCAHYREDLPFFTWEQRGDCYENTDWIYMKEKK